MEIYREYLLKSEKEKIPFKVPQRSHVVQNPKKKQRWKNKREKGSSEDKETLGNNIEKKQMAN